MQGLSIIFTLFCNEFNKSNNAGAQILVIYNVGSFLSLDSKTILRENVTILLSPTQRYKGRQYVTLLNLQTTSGLSIILHGDIHVSLPVATSCDNLISNNIFSIYILKDFKNAPPA